MLNVIIKYVVIPWFQAANKIKEVDWGDDLMYIFKHEWQNKNVCLTSMSYDVLNEVENSKWWCVMQ